MTKDERSADHQYDPTSGFRPRYSEYPIRMMQAGQQPYPVWYTFGYDHHCYEKEGKKNCHNNKKKSNYVIASSPLFKFLKKAFSFSGYLCLKFGL